MEHIVVGMDGSDHAAASLRWAVDEARRRQTGVTAVLAWSLLDQHHAEPGAEFDPAYSADTARAALGAFVDAAFDPAFDPAVDRGDRDLVELSVVCDRPAAALIDAAREASLLVVGPRGLGGFRSLLLGSVTQQCLHHLACPLAIVRDGTIDERRRIVVGIDGSLSSRHALDWALDEARLRGCVVEAVHTWIPPTAYGYPLPIPLDSTATEHAAQDMVEGVVAAADTSGLVSPVETVLVRGGSPAGAVLTRAEEAELVVVGSRGVGGFRGLLLGSLAHHVAQHAPGTAVIVPPR